MAWGWWEAHHPLLFASVLAESDRMVFHCSSHAGHGCKAPDLVQGDELIGERGCGFLLLRTLVLLLLGTWEGVILEVRSCHRRLRCLDRGEG